MTAPMLQLDVRIVQLPSMRVAAAHAEGSAAEIAAWRQLRAWAEPRGLLSDTVDHPVFGFNSPTPSPKGGNHGYEFWIRVDDDAAQPVDSIEIKEFDGGLYAVTTTSLTDAAETWRELWDWVKDSGYTFRQTHELERVRNPRTLDDRVVVDLYLPIQRVH